MFKLVWHCVKARVEAVYPHRCSYRPGKVERQAQPGVLLDAERVGAQHRCDGFAKNAVSRRHHRLEVLQTHPEISLAARHAAAAASICQQTFRVLKLMELYLEYT